MTPAPTLRDLGISKQQSSNWQRLAEVPKERFEAALADPIKKPTTASIICAAGAPNRPLPRQPLAPEPMRVADDALWVWGRLMDFERDGVLVKDPKSVALSMTEAMLDDVHELAPRVAKWLRRIGDLA